MPEQAAAGCQSSALCTLQTQITRPIHVAKTCEKSGLDALLKDAVKGDFRLVAAWGHRSLQDLIAFLNELQVLGVDLFLHNQGLDTTTPTLTTSDPTYRYGVQDEAEKAMRMDADARHIEIPATCHPNTLAMYRYWLEKCAGKRMPRRSDIDPTTMPRQTLPGISMVEVVPDERRYVYRLVGTGEVEVRGNDPTGESVKEGFFGPSAEDALSCYDRVVSTCAPLLDTVPFTSPGGRYVNLETLFLPLSEDGANVSKILVFSHSEGLLRFVSSARP